VFPVAFIEFFVNSVLSIVEWIINVMITLSNVLFAMILNVPIMIVNSLLKALYQVPLISDALKGVMTQMFGSPYIPYIVNPIKQIDIPTFSMGLKYHNYSPLAQVIASIFPVPLEYAYVFAIVFFAIMLYFIIRIRSAI